MLRRFVENREIRLRGGRSAGAEAVLDVRAGDDDPSEGVDLVLVAFGLQPDKLVLSAGAASQLSKLLWGQEHAAIRFRNSITHTHGFDAQGARLPLI